MKKTATTSRKLGAEQSLLRAPKQGRSRQTLRRLISATRELLEQNSFDDISIAAIAKRGDASVGAFYARFKDKDALLDHLAGLFADEMTAEDELLRSDEVWREKPLKKIVGDTVARMVTAHRRHSGVLRALMLHSAGAGGSVEIDRAIGLAGPLPVLAEEIKKRRGEINHPDPEIAVRLGLGMVSSSVRERILFPELDPKTAGSVPITDAVLVEELARAVLGFLGVDAG
jgi:AcrR family transcriptional regulator